MYAKKQNPEFKQKIQFALRNFQKEYEKYQYDYKLLIGESDKEISLKDGYLSFFQNIRDHLEDNTIYFVTEEDIKRYPRDVMIQRTLEDIYKKKDLDDPRVLVYAQPVYDVNTDSLISVASPCKST